MKPKPILFSTPMVQAYLEDRKEMTRRIAKFPKDYSGGTVYPNGSFGLKYAIADGTIHRLHAKYQPGDILWVKETFYAYGHWTENGKSKSGKQKCMFIDFTDIDADGQYGYFDSVPDEVIEGRGLYEMGWYKRPSLFMPYEAARIFLEVTNVRAERLQDITEEDAKAEGALKQFQVYPEKARYRFGFVNLWESINGPGSWDANPWVFVYEFKGAEKPSLL